jgi:hypothetical protein
MTTWFRLPLVVRLVVIALAWLGYGVLVLDFNAMDIGSRSAKIIGTACSVGAALAVGFDVGWRPKARSMDQLSAYRRALRSSELPTPIELDEWRRWVVRSDLLNGFAPFSAGPFVFFGLASSLSSQSAYSWVPASAFTLLAIWGAVAWWRRHLQIVRLRAEIEQRAAAKTVEGQAAVTRVEAYFRTPRAMRALVTAAMGFTVALVALLMADLESVIFGDSRLVHLEWAAFCAAPMGLASALAESVEPTLRNTSGSVEQLIAYDRGLRTGELPTYVEPDVWRSWLRSSRRTLGMPLLWACFFGAAGVSSILTDQSGYHWVTAFLFQLLAIWMLLGWSGKRAQITQLAGKVERYAVRQRWG